jgi:formylglycine-generating enzyme required for sulfatase activity
MVMVYVPAGTYWMGSDDSDPDARPGEKPQHEVSLDAFWIDRTEVTNAQYARFLNALGGHQGECEGQDCIEIQSRTSQSHIRLQGGQYVVEGGYEEHPMIEVSWYGAHAYCEWAGGRFPTEAEWEKAARGTDGRIYPWGNQDADRNRANYGLFVGDTSQVGNYPAGASRYGALDMAGNVWEWVSDWESSTYYNVSPYENPQGPETGSYKLMRGGSWTSGWEYIRAASHGYLDPVVCQHDVGFRCVVVGPGE